MKSRIYVDTSVIGGCEDDEFRVSSRDFFNAIKEGRAIAVISGITLGELVDAPKKVREVLDDIGDENMEFVELTDEARGLAELYIEAGVVGEKMRVDAQHIAVATINRVDVLISWNFKHVVNLNRIRGYNSVNLKNGYPVLEIRKPDEVLEYDD